MNKYSKNQLSLFVAINILSLLLRFTHGWWLIGIFWLIIPHIVIHLWGQIKTYDRTNLNKIDRQLVTLSTILFILIPLLQVGEMEHGNYTLFEKLFGDIFSQDMRDKTFYFLLPVYVLDAIINLILISREKKAKLHQISN